MATMGIIGCTVLTNELTYLISRDLDIHKVVVVNNVEGQKLVTRLDRSHIRIEIELVEWERVGLRTYGDGELIVWMNSSEMHHSKERMRNALTSEILLMSESADCILLLYGQCRCQTLDIEKLEEETEIPILYLVDRHNVIVDDCISAIIGSSENYLKAMKQYKGAFFLTPGYVEGYALKVQGQNIVELVDEVELVNSTFDFLGRPPLIKLDNQIDGGIEYHQMIDMFARLFNLEVHTISCDLKVFEDSYDWARSMMEARGRVGSPIMVPHSHKKTDVMALYEYREQNRVQ
jgi:hypothetical protein